ncbi:3,4-dihydroxyphenylacetate 2,3-dioxygenase [Ktedonobacter sp. SOSP1-52]|uniref:VOC family protein n=1 Tax=Ktedonobacter sp. SOSP1-52 TaxID=2778366 RepID=UPI001914E502|nr:VOC family protein [Ktedonobacter sp. SOSP1-52]GHO65473.1 3,4-dihydroxyphenylacetate 2,3-dioxygenase [Ktedonobacter sp. SOSP1-52]
MLHIAKLGYVALTTPHVEDMWTYYTEVIGFSLAEREDDGTSYLRHTTDHHTIAIYPAAEASLRHIGFQIGQGQTLKEVASQLFAQGVQVEMRADVQPGVPELLQFADPEGNSIHLYSSIEQSRRGLLDRGIAPEKLGHVAFHVRNIQPMVDFYQRILGFAVSDWIEQRSVFLRCGPDHHTIQLIQQDADMPGTRGMHHIAFQLHDWTHIQRACDHLAKKNIALSWGPGRHGPGHSLFMFHRDPDGNLIELFSDMDLVLNEDLGYFEPRPWHTDCPQRPKVWSRSLQAANIWGIAPPETFFSSSG